MSHYTFQYLTIIVIIIVLLYMCTLSAIIVCKFTQNMPSNAITIVDALPFIAKECHD